MTKQKSMLLKYLIKEYKEQLITQGIFDDGNFKCVFLIGPPGAGKSTVGASLFNVEFNMSKYGLKVVNPDYAFVKHLQKNNLPLDMDSQDIPKSVKDKQFALRDKTKDLTNRVLMNFMQQRKGIIIDSTGNTIGSLLKRKQMAQANGYDTLMIYVGVSLQTSLRRNSKRERVVPQDVVKSIWHSVQKNKKLYKSVFGDDFIQIVNQDNTSVDGKIKQAIRRFLTSPPQNPIARHWIQLQKKNRGIK